MERYYLKRLLIQRHQLNVQAMSQQLRNLITVNHCDLFVHLLTEGFLVTMMKPKFATSQQMAYHHHQICQLELKRIVTLVENRSPIVQMQFPLTLLWYNRTIAEKVANFAPTKQIGEERGKTSRPVLHSAVWIMVFIYNLIKFI